MKKIKNYYIKKTSFKVDVNVYVIRKNQNIKTKQKKKQFSMYSRYSYLLKQIKNHI